MRHHQTSNQATKAEMNETHPINDEWKDLLFSVRRSIRYHNRRRMFFDRLHKVTNGIGVVLGSAAVFTALKEIYPFLTILSGVTIALFSALDLIIGTAQMARLHTDLARRFIQLEKAMIMVDEASTDALKSFTAERLDIEAEEPPVLHVLNTICHNELMRAMGYEEEEMVRIAPMQRFLSPFFDFKEHQLG